MKYAQIIRDFLSTLFGSKLVIQLRHEIAELKEERNYFRGRCERLEMARESAQQRVAAVPRPSRDQTPMGRKLWPQLMKERREKIAQQAAEAEKQKREAAKTN